MKIEELQVKLSANSLRFNEAIDNITGRLWELEQKTSIRLFNCYIWKKEFLRFKNRLELKSQGEAFKGNRAQIIARNETQLAMVAVGLGRMI